MCTVLNQEKAVPIINIIVMKIINVTTAMVSITPVIRSARELLS